MKLYHYTKFDTFIYDILPKMQLKFFPFSSSNDPIEFSRLFQIDLSEFSWHYREEIIEAYQRKMNKYMFICFSKSKNNKPGFKLPTMWAHYGENHNGVCLEIDASKLDFGKYSKKSLIKKSVRYRIPNPESKIILGSQKNGESDMEFIERSISEHVKEWELINNFTKVIDWRTENEYRIVYERENSEDHYLNINDALIKVFVGIRASRNWSESVRLKILEHQISETNMKLGREIQLEFLENEGSSINSCELKLRRTIRDKNSESSRKMELKIRGEDLSQF